MAQSLRGTFVKLGQSGKVGRIMSGTRDDSAPIGHYNVLALPGNVLALPSDPESSFFEGVNCLQMTHTGYLRDVLCRNIYFPQILLAGQLPGNLLVFPDRILNICQSLLFGRTLRPEPGESGAGNNYILPWSALKRLDTSLVHYGAVPAFSTDPFPSTPLSNRACGFPAHGLTMIFLMWRAWRPTHCAIRPFTGVSCGL